MSTTEATNLGLSKSKENVEETEKIFKGDIEEESIEEEINLAKNYSSHYFLEKHSPSFKCFEQFLCSSSDLRLTLSYFPPLTDPGLDECLNYVAPEEEQDPDGVTKYTKMCKDLEIVPIKRIINSLASDTLDLKYYGITLKQMRGLADALKVNGKVKYVNLQDNWMCPDSTALISDFLRESNSIRVLNLTECRIGKEGAEKLADGIASTQFLAELDLSFNSLTDEGLSRLQASFMENTSIRKLNLSHNELTEASGVTLEQILLENKSISDLNLAWNSFFTAAGNKKLCNGLIKNGFVTALNLSWNGIGTPGAMRPIRRYIRKTEVLEYLDLSWNRITRGCLKMIRSALVKNKSLKSVKLGYNIYTPDEAQFLARFFLASKTTPVEELDMEGMCVNKSFLELRAQLRRLKKKITHGHILSNYVIHGPNINKLLFERCRYLCMKPKKKKKKKDFGHFVLALPDKPMTSQDFQDLLKKKKIKKLDKDLLTELLSRFVAKRGKVDCATLKESYMALYPDTVLPEEKKKKKKKGKRKKKKKKKQ